MISKIIQKEEERQKELFSGCGEEFPDNLEDFELMCGKHIWNKPGDVKIYNLCPDCKKKIKDHKQHLVEVKKYFNENVSMKISGPCSDASFDFTQIDEDIQELNKMIERYKRYK